MSRVPIAWLAVATLVLHAMPAAAEPIEVDLRAALERAHRVAPDAIAARGRIAQAEAAIAGADVLFTANPGIEAGAGPRFLAGRSLDLDVRVEQDLEPWRRDPRRRVARAELAHTRAEAGVQLRELDLEVSLAFYEALHADRMAEVARRGEELAQRGADAAERRRKAGDITDLDANLARAALGRARAATLSAASERAMAVGRLAARIGAAPGDAITLRGDLKPSSAPAPSARITARPDVRALEQEREVAIAQHAQAAANGRPELALWAAYQREDAASILVGGLRVTLPTWNRAQGDKAVARATERRATEIRDATIQVARRQIADALAAHASARQSVDTFEREVAPLLDDSEQLLQKMVDAGQIAVSDYLVARQQLLDGRREQLDRLLALAKAAVVVDFVAGGAP
jgi:cobalt-zinc-cadmium efflux system outer membrane protein